jgi:hypothetical protein
MLMHSLEASLGGLQQCFSHCSLHNHTQAGSLQSGRLNDADKAKASAHLCLMSMHFVLHLLVKLWHDQFELIL